MIYQAARPGGILNAYYCRKPVNLRKLHTVGVTDILGGRDGWMASPTQWTWVWATSRRWWRTGKPGVLQSMGSQRVGHGLATEQHHTGRVILTIWRPGNGTTLGTANRLAFPWVLGLKQRMEGWDTGAFQAVKYSGWDWNDGYMLLCIFQHS